MSHRSAQDREKSSEVNAQRRAEYNSVPAPDRRHRRRGTLPANVTIPIARQASSFEETHVLAQFASVDADPYVDSNPSSETYLRHVLPPMSAPCKHCFALLFPPELRDDGSGSICCCRGKVLMISSSVRVYQL